jgi:hypothetical protein
MAHVEIRDNKVVSEFAIPQPGVPGYQRIADDDVRLLAFRGPSLDDYRIAIQNHIDNTARAKSYDSGMSLAGYVSSTVETWVSEATTFIAWRDNVWLYVYQQLEAVQQAQRAQPTPAELIAELPAIVW